MQGTTWAYKRLVAEVYKGDMRQVEKLALQFTTEVRENCAGCALADIDDAVRKQISPRPYQVLVRVLDGIKLKHEAKGG